MRHNDNPAILLLVGLLAGLLYYLHGTVVELQHEVAKVKMVQDGAEKRLADIEMRATQ